MRTCLYAYDDGDGPFEGALALCDAEITDDYSYWWPLPNGAALRVFICPAHRAEVESLGEAALSEPVENGGE